ncbi:unnamed protein product [Symbiodinium microadriaticum]|nr:unnamed protein product [Symbiodinium microadriaticum]
MFAQVTRGPRRVGDEPTLIVPGAMEEGPSARLSGSGKKDEEGLRQSPAWPQAPFCALGILVDLRTWLSHLNLSSGSGQIPLISSDHLDSSTERNPLGDFQQRVYEVGLVCLASGIVINFLAVHFWFRRKFLVSMPWYEYHKHGLGLHVIFLLMPPPRPTVRRYANPQACFLFTCRQVLSRIGCLSLLSDTKALVYFLDSTGIQVTRVSMGVTVIHLALAPSSKHSLRWPRARLTGFIYEFGLEGNGLPDAELGCEEPLEEFFDALQEDVERATLETCQSSGSTLLGRHLFWRAHAADANTCLLQDALSEWELDAPVKAQLAHPTGWGRVVQPVILCKEPLSVLLSFLSVGFCLCHGDWHRGQREAERLPILSIACFLGAFAASFLPPRLRPGAREESEDYRRYLQRYKERRQTGDQADKLVKLVGKCNPAVEDELRIYIGRFPGEIRNLLDTRTAELRHDKKSKAEKVKTKKEHKSKKEKKKEGKKKEKKQKKPAKESKHHTADEGYWGDEEDETEPHTAQNTDVQIVPAAVSDPPRGGGPRGRRKHARSRGDRQWTGPKMRARLRELLKVEVVWGRRPLRWSPTKKRHYDQALARHHTDAEEQQLQGEHADRVQSKLLYRKALEVFRFLRTFGGKPVKFLQQVAKDTRWIEKVHTACWWGDQPPVGGGSEDYSEEIVELPTSEWLNTEEGEQSPYTPPSADRPQDDAGNLLGHSTQALEEIEELMQQTGKSKWGNAFDNAGGSPRHASHGDWWLYERHHGLGNAPRTDRRSLIEAMDSDNSGASHRRRRMLAAHTGEAP